MRRAAAAAERGVQPRLAQRVEVCPAERGRGVDDRLGRDGARDPAGGALPGRRHRDEPVSAGADRRDGEVQSPDRPRHHGLGRSPLHDGPCLRQHGGHRAGRARHVVRQGEVARPVRQAGRGARAVPELEPLDLPRGPADAELDGHDNRADRHHLDDRRLLVRHRADLRARFPASREEPRRRACADVRQRDVRADRQGPRPLLRCAQGGDRQARLAARDPRRAGGGRARVQDVARDRLRVACPPSGRLPALHRQRREQDDQPP